MPKQVLDFTDSIMTIPEREYWDLSQKLKKLIEAYAWDVHRDGKGNIKFTISSERLIEFAESTVNIIPDRKRGL